MSNENKYDELLELRKEMDELKAELNKQRIVDERLMRRVMSTAYDKERRRQTFSMILVVALAPIEYYLLDHLGLPLYFIIMTIASFIVAFAFSCYMRVKYWSSDMLTGELTRVAYEMASYKRAVSYWLLACIPFLAVWVLLYMNCVAEVYGESAIFGVVVGLVLGGILASWGYLRMRRRVDNILNQIEECRGSLPNDEAN